VRFGWDGTDLLGSAPVTANSAVADVTVPTQAKLGPHWVTAACADPIAGLVSDTYLAGPMARQKFDVIPKPPAVNLTPDTGDPGSSATANAENLDCDTATADWDNSKPLPRAVVESGHAAIHFTVPTDAKPGSHTVTVTCGQTHIPNTFNVLEPPRLVLEPQQGAPGKRFQATVTGLDACGPVQYRWDDTPLEPVSGAADPAPTFMVPADASATEHTVTATCVGTPRHAPAPFTVVAAAKPVLNLLTGHGAPGDRVTASGSGFACPTGDVRLLWDGDDVPTHASPGAFTVQLTVPASAPGVRTVTASCDQDPSIADAQHFTVISIVTSQPAAPPPRLQLDRTSGHSGDRVHVAGDGFACADRGGPVKLSWDDGTALPDETLDATGHFDASLTVPTTAAGSLLTLHATCAPNIMLAADYTVLGPTPLPPPPPPPRIPWALIALAALIAVAAGLAAAKHMRRSRPPTPPQVHALLRDDALPTVTVREAPQPGEVTHVLCVEAKTGPATVTIEEVHDDDTAH
jgi:hypothetical protein